MLILHNIVVTSTTLCSLRLKTSAQAFNQCKFIIRAKQQKF